MISRQDRSVESIIDIKYDSVGLVDLLGELSSLLGREDLPRCGALPTDLHRWYGGLGHWQHEVYGQSCSLIAFSRPNMKVRWQKL